MRGPGKRQQHVDIEKRYRHGLGWLVRAQELTRDQPVIRIKRSPHIVETKSGLSIACGEYEETVSFLEWRLSKSTPTRQPREGFPN